MGKRGKASAPTAIKKLKGTFRPDRAVRNELTPTKGAPVCPGYLSKTARAEWDRVVPQLAELGVLTLVDGGVLEGYCANYGLAVEMQQRADKKPIEKTPFGPKVNPAVSEARKAWALAKQFASEIGLSPAARTRVGTPDKAKEKDTTEDFLFGRNTARVIEGGGGK